MSTLEVACGQCERRFRVRAEFAGRSTRCPGCSAPITVGAAARPAPPRADSDDRPRPRPRPRDDDEPRRPTADWRPVEMAFSREQVAVLCVLASIVLDYFLFCVSQGAGPGGGEGLVALVVIVLAAPALAAAAFGLMARIAAIRTPPESVAKGSAVASLLCGLAGAASLVILAFTLLLSLDSQRANEAPMVVAVGGLVFSVLGSLATFAAFTAQVGIARRSAAVSGAFGRMAIGVCASVLGLLGIGVLYAIGSELAAPSTGWGGSYQRHDLFYQVCLGVLFPLALAVVLILYHRLLAAGRRAVQGEPAGRYDG